MARKKDTSKIFDEFVAIKRHHRKFALRMLAVPKDRAARICLLRYTGQANACLLSIEKISVTSLVEATCAVVIMVCRIEFERGVICGQSITYFIQIAKILLAC